MVQPNFLVMALAALIPIIIGALWYSPLLFAKTWMRITGKTEQDLKQGNFAVILLLTYILSFVLAFMLNMMVIHQFHLFSVVQNVPGVDDPNSEVGKWLADSMQRWGSNFRTFKHGALHGFLGGLFFALPVIGINAQFERRGWKYIWLHTGYWVITLALMGGVICQFT